MPTEIKDIFTSVTYEEQGGNIKRANRTFLITGLTTPMDPADPGYDGPAGRIEEAAGVLTVAQGSRHPTYSFLFCKSRTATIIDLDKVQFELVYEPINFTRSAGPQEAPATAVAVEDGYVVSGRTFLEQEETFVDRAGNAIELTFPDYPTVAVSVPVDRQRRQLVMERSILTATPGSFGNTYVGKTNNATWQGGAAGTWRCEGVDFDQINPSVSNGGAPETFLPLYRVRFTFAYNPNGWNPSVVYTDPETGNPIAGWDGHAGASDVVDIYEQVSFGSLPL